MLNVQNHILIGVDGGGSGCRAAIGTRLDGIIAQAEGGSANATSNAEIAVQNVIATVQNAAERAGLSAGDLGQAVAHLGLAGVISPEGASKIASALPFGESVVTDDRAIAVTGALGGLDGHLLSVGTGTIVAASKGGAFSFVNGWGFQVSDQGSGAWLGRAALEHLLLCHDGLAAASDFSRSLMAQFNNDPNEIVAFSTSASPNDFGTFAPAITSGARAGDPWAKDILSEGASFLTKGLTQLGFQAGDRLCLTGGLGPHYTDYLPPDFQKGLTPAKGNALDGAFSLAKLAAIKRQDHMT